MITDIKTPAGKKASKEQIKKIKLWQLQLESLSKPTHKKGLKSELSAIKMHSVSKNKVVCMNKHENLSKHLDNHFLKPTVKVVSLSKRKHQH